MASFGGVQFDIIQPSPGHTYAGWSRRPKMSVRPIAGGDTEVVQVIGFTASVVDRPIYLTVGNLVTLESLMGGQAIFVDWDGTTYTDTLLEDVSGTASRSNGMVAATIKLRRG